MEMHQVRYFLAVADELNFTRAAEKCNVAQPSLTRAIRQLEGELGGDLFRRERPRAQLTELGERMYPLLRQCYESALGARSLASSMKSGDVGSLRLALSRTIDLGLIMPHLLELKQTFRNLQLKFLRGCARDIAEFLRQGQADLAVAAGTGGDAWERLDRWPLFTEDFLLAVSSRHRLAGHPKVELEDLREEKLLLRTYCESAEELSEAFRKAQLEVDRGHEMASERDLIMLLEANIGVAVVPRSAAKSTVLARLPVDGLDVRRTVYLYGVAGRQRTPVATTVMKMLRGADWSRHLD
ncbi:MAG: LysR family transcriptional regulator [Xanthobacteraceae bacterium]